MILIRVNLKYKAVLYEILNMINRNTINVNYFGYVFAIEK